MDELKNLIKTIAFQKTDTPSFPLSSGQKSCFYFNMKKITYLPKGQVLIGKVIYDKIQELNLKPKAIGGLTMGADPISVATAFTSFLKDNPIEAFAIRKEPKEHGMRLQIEGNVDAGDSVIIVDDVVTTGKSTIQAIDIARKHGLNVLCAIILVDRCEENGHQNIESKGIKVYSIFTIHDFKSE
ncbi:MAG: orotate phosphoribosyltransferase [Proteobacteria bacterium]|nr:orotate phosphoribosyltransferase [Desulfobacteraceae bacterium]MBU4013753.1 orotate phosphoribosyltransferase [Pseudomonadota bacterium]MBU4067015.1 orotate phosphoribosyltransferase [Pseudomonadota bacterium]MBU4101957.1 orotate phosphoribosyltransferase [Pseudomonadota bacterium]MBU4127461.1 orotate phosphoribosyltransferase [Pseudomonadota bacterium]